MIAVMAVDPGTKGAVAVLSGDGRQVFVQPFKPSMTHAELIAVIRQSLASLAAYHSSSVFVEKVGYMPTDGGKGANTFGRVDGLIRGGILMAGYPIVDVAPMMWQAEMDCLTGGDKNVSKRRAQELFPALKITHAIADALLIAEYGRRRLTL